MDRQEKRYKEYKIPDSELIEKLGLDCKEIERIDYHSPGYVGGEWYVIIRSGDEDDTEADE